MKLLKEDVETFDIKEELNEKGEKDFYLEGIFLQANKKNRNGRIYPMEVMKPEVDRYIQTYVDSGRALGEMGHPCFLSNDFEVLTINGWKPFSEVQIGDSVIGSDENRKFAESIVTNKTDGVEYNGDCYHFKGRHIDSIVSAPHRFYCLDRNNHMVVKTAEELYKNSSHIRIIKNIIADNVENETITIKGIETKNHNYHKVDPRSDITFDAKDFCRFLGFWLAEGCLHPPKGNSIGTTVCVSQNEGKHADAYIELVKRMGYEPIVYVRENGIGNKNLNITFTDARLYAFLKPLGNCYTKYIPNEVKQLSGSSLIELIRWFGYGDGRSYEYVGKTTKSQRRELPKNIFSTSKQLIDDLFVVAIKSGLSGKIRTIIHDPNKDYIFSDHLVKGENVKPLYVFEVSDVSGIHLDRRHISIEKVESTGKVYCLTTTSHNFFVRQNGKVWLTGNCGHGQTPNINLERVSHKIEKIWQEGDYFCACAKILDTPYGRIVKELIKEGCQLGVSSRALGSVQRRNGIDYVGHDFRLITAGDIVWEPSAQAAFPKGIMEDLEWEYDETTGEFVQKEISESVDLKKLSTLQIEAFKTFLNQIKSR